MILTPGIFSNPGSYLAGLDIDLVDIQLLKF
jgi:hypothetical protein